ncbi:radical SAM family protein [Clostridium combesii]|uniref:Radical SAM protein n=1 Tax=Clostridium combesii TaxID=39481 RepID=A0A2G7HGE6_9CLOT|nr:radical SAM protein [Clostridium combesii]PIH04169.1 hypothetical protein CS538_10625 [Clostridium combesii]
MNNYVYGDEKRLFLNSSLGCSGKCTYCYLPDLGLDNSKNISVFKEAYEIISMVHNSPKYIEGEKGTIISVGCYSECWDNLNKKQTLRLVQYFLSKGNPVQIATKKRIYAEELYEIREKIKWDKQFSIFVSIPTISSYIEHEKGTSSPFERIENFKIEKELGIPIILYIKPVLNNITVNDIDKYIQIIKYYGISVVVGSLFNANINSGKIAPIGQGKLYYKNSEQELEIINQLKKYCSIYRKSTDFINEKRDEHVFKNISIS